MSVFTAEQLDLTRLPTLTLVAVDQAAEAAALKKGAAARLNAAGIPYDVEGLETDSVAVLCEEFAYRKALDLQAINDTGRSLSLTYGNGAALDHIAATIFADLGLRRLALVAEPRPFLTNPEDWESDDRFRLRISLAPQARTAGTLGGYEYAALTAAPFLDDALALNYAAGLCGPGEIVVIVLGRDPDPNPQTAVPAQEEPAQLTLARNALMNRDTKLGSDVVSVRAARRVAVARGYTVGVRGGPDPNLVLNQGRAEYAAYVAGRRRIGKLLAESGEKAALTVGGVEYVHPKAGSGADVDPGLDGVAIVASLDLTAEVIGG